MVSAWRSLDRLRHPARSSVNTLNRWVHAGAAPANGISIHADDYDDTGSAFHVASPVLPPSFALCETGKRSGKDLMLAFHVGVEVGNKIGDAMSPRHQQEGYHTTGTIGTMGSAAACAKLRGLDEAKTAIASVSY